MNRLDFAPPAVVLGFDYGGLAVARTLGRLGVRVHAVHADPRAAALRSRYCRGVHVWDLARASTADSLAFLDDLGCQLGPAVLLPTTDQAAVFMAAHTDELAPRFLFPRAPSQLVRAFTDRREVVRLATQCGIPTPRTAFPRAYEDVVRFASEATFPVILKPFDRSAGEPDRSPRVAILGTPDALLRRYVEWEDPTTPRLMVQEHIPGDARDVWIFNGVFNEWSECVAAFTGRALRQYPGAGGSASLARCEPNPTLERLTLDFMWALRYHGVLDARYRFDARDGRYKLLDPHPHIGPSFRLFVDGDGLDLARILYCDLVAQPVWPGPARPGRTWVVEDQDLAASLALVARDPRQVGRWVKSWVGVEETAWFARDDLRPFLRIAGRLLRDGARAAGRGVVDAVRTALRGALLPRHAH